MWVILEGDTCLNHALLWLVLVFLHSSHVPDLTGNINLIQMGNGKSGSGNFFLCLVGYAPKCFAYGWGKQTFPFSTILFKRNTTGYVTRCILHKTNTFVNLSLSPDTGTWDQNLESKYEYFLNQMDPFACWPFVLITTFEWVGTLYLLRQITYIIDSSIFPIYNFLHSVSHFFKSRLSKPRSSFH